MRNYWYVSRYDEILLDIDGKSQQKLLTSLSRIRGLIENSDYPDYPINKIWMFPSFASNHYHIVINLSHEITWTEKTALQLYFFSDTFRTCCNMMRTAKFHDSPDLLISPANWKRFGFYRMHDASCTCETKHSHAVMNKCPAAVLLRGNNRACDFFSKPISPEGFFKKKFGLIWEV